MPKKKSVTLPSVRGATPRGKDFLNSRADVSELSTTAPLSGSLAGTSRSPLEAEVSPSLLASSDDWTVQSPEDIIAEVKRCVQARKPWREEVDEALLMEKRNRERQEGIDGGFQIILPDNGVRSMEDQLSRRLRAQLLGEEDSGPDNLAASFQGPKQDEAKAKAGGRKNLRNPWYLSPNVWFSGDMGKDPNEEDSKGFPYDTMILGEGVAKKKNENLLDNAIKESAFVEAYKQHMQGYRLPHFLQ